MLPKTPSSTRVATSLSTPMMIRSGSVRDSDATDPVVVEDLNNILAIELRDATIYEATSLVEAVFPDKYLPLAIDEKLLQSLKAIYGKNGWIRPATDSEPSSADWLNRIANALAKKCGIRLRRRWCFSKHASPVKGSAIRRKPDLVLIDAQHRPVDWDPQWKDIRAIGEVTSQATFHLKLRNQILNKAYVAMNQQDDRRFVVFLTFFNHTSFHITLCDRAGVIYSPAYNIYHDALHLLRILTGLMFSEEHVLGHDPTIRRGPDDTIVAILIAGVEYQVVKKLFSSSSMRGRATKCWHVKKDEEEYAIKDSWIHEGRKSNEADILRQISGVACVPTLIAAEDLKHPGDPNITDSTRLHRAGLQYDEARLHRRILMQPVGESVWSFTSKKELIGALIDVITAHRTLCQEHRILHRDISKNNLLLWHDRNANQNHRRGLLIDYDYAEKLDIEGDFSLGTRTGTGPFMAIEVLHYAGNKEIKQKPAHDLESIFYVLLYICTLYKGPDATKRSLEDLEDMSSVAINEWFVMHKRFRDLADKKKGQLSQFQSRFLRRFPPYFDDLRTCMSRLWDNLFPSATGEADDPMRDLSSCAGTHEGMLEVLHAIYNQLPYTDMVETDLSSSKGKAKKRTADDDGGIKRRKQYTTQDTSLQSGGNASLNLAPVRRSTRVRKSASIGFSRSNEEHTQVPDSGVFMSRKATSSRSVRRVQSTGSHV